VSVAPHLADPLPGLVEELLRGLGEDPDRPGLRGTPTRVVQSLRFLTEGYEMDAAQVAAGALFDQQYDEMILVKDIPLFSLCEHHMLPFFGSAHVAYVPDGRVVGLSKIPRIVDVFARRLQVQERLTRQVAEAILSVTGAKGAAVVATARHLCMEMRGVEKPGAQTVTSCMLGCFRSDGRTRAELLDLIGSR
jgi:GTP cyclohydrolase IA